MTRYICGYSKAEYNERLLHLHLAPLSLRRDQKDVIYFWKCLHRIYDLNLTKFVSFSTITPDRTVTPHKVSCLIRLCFRKRHSDEVFLNGYITCGTNYQTMTDVSQKRLNLKKKKKI